MTFRCDICLGPDAAACGSCSEIHFVCQRSGCVEIHRTLCAVSLVTLPTMPVAGRQSVGSTVTATMTPNYPTMKPLQSTMKLLQSMAKFTIPVANRRVSLARVIQLQTSGPAQRDRTAYDRPARRRVSVSRSPVPDGDAARFYS